MGGEEEGLVEVLEAEAAVVWVAGRVAPLGGEVLAPAEEQALGAAVGEVEAVPLVQDTQHPREDIPATHPQ